MSESLIECDDSMSEMGDTNHQKSLETTLVLSVGSQAVTEVQTAYTNGQEKRDRMANAQVLPFRCFAASCKLCPGK